jgi:hypothetical protein
MGRENEISYSVIVSQRFMQGQEVRLTNHPHNKKKKKKKKKKKNTY